MGGVEVEEEGGGWKEVRQKYGGGQKRKRIRRGGNLK